MRVGFIGAGNIARAHGAAMRQVEGIDLVAAFDSHAPTLDRYCADFGIRPAGRLEELFDQVDAIYVLTPPKEHHDALLSAIAAGKHVLCEKPIAVALADAREMVAAAEAAGVVFAMGFNNRARPQLQWLKHAVENGDLGDVLQCWIRRLGYSRLPPESDWRTKTGALAGMTIQSITHDIDMLRFVVGEIADVSGAITSSMPEVPEYDDNLSATLIFENGVIGNIHASWSAHVGHGSRGVIGTRGTASIEGPGLWAMTHTRFSNTGDEAERIERFTRQTGDYQGYVGIAESFRDAVTDGTPPLSTGHDGLRALAVSHAILESARSRRFVDSRALTDESPGGSSAEGHADRRE